MERLTSVLALLQELNPNGVVVTGAQRSGTRIAAHTLAHELDYDYVDEDVYGTKNLIGWKRVLSDLSHIIVHSPAMARWVHDIDRDDWAVVWILRPSREVEASIDRIGWNGAAAELAKYKDTGIDFSAHTFSQVKNNYWLDVQRSQIAHAYELHYGDLKEHPFFVKQQDRQEFSPRQWKVGTND